MVCMLYPWRLTSAHLLTDHDDARCLRSSTHARERKELREALEEIALGVETSFANQFIFLGEQGVGVV